MFKSLDLKNREYKVIDTRPKMAAKKKVVPINTLRDKVQKEFNKYIRRRDMDKGCVSCNGPVENAGHFYNAGQYTALRFSEINVHGQCVGCNKYRHGNLLHYRSGLLKRIGEQKLNLLEATATRDRVKKWERFELEALFVHYKLLNGNTD